MSSPRLLSVLLVLCALPGLADEGMWPYNRLPLGELDAKYKFDPSPELIAAMQHGSVRLNNGGSGSFVTPDGLVMTNHHVASDCIRKLSSEGKDYIADGFYAPTRARELKCPDLELNVLMEIEPVTDSVNRKVMAEMSDAERLEAQKAATAQIEKDCRDSTLMRCDVVNLYQGGVFDLYKYKRYTDVRLVFAPEFSMAYFGGDPDNFTYPRYCLDVSFLRVYDKGQVVTPPAVLPLEPKGAAEGDMTVVSGHPGSTERQLTESQLQFERDRRMPFMLEWLRAMADALQVYGRSGGDASRRARDELFRIDNSIKAYTGQLAGLRDPELFAAKAAAEASLRKKVAADEKLQSEYGGAWDEIAKAQRVKKDFYDEYRLLDGLGFFTRYFTIARHLYRMAEELPKPNDERLPEYRDTALESLEQQLYSPAPIYPDVEIVKLARSLSFLRDRLGPNHPDVQQILGSRTPLAVAQQLIEGTKLADVDFRKQLGADKAAAAKTSDDPMMRLVASLDERARALRKRYEDEVEAVESANGAHIARARFAVYGDKVYPDATFTLRLSFGVIKAYLEQRRRIPAFTDIAGLFAKATGQDPYILPKRVLAAEKRLKGDTPYNLVSTNDITGGNSGSPLLNRDGRVVGLIFDGNIQSLPNDFLYSEKQARAVSVDVRGILEMLRNAYKATALVRELEAAGK
ncbi:MAG: S46 family peptidase [Acidobacteria bacterium]|nr:S46 family peptidase [Acidobacteriota bacterium]